MIQKYKNVLSTKKNTKNRKKVHKKTVQFKKAQKVHIQFSLKAQKSTKVVHIQTKRQKAQIHCK